MNETLKEIYIWLPPLSLKAKSATKFGKGVARRLRVANKIPATIYAGGADPAFVTLPMRETTLALRHTNALFTIEFGGESKMAVVRTCRRTRSSASSSTSTSSRSRPARRSTLRCRCSLRVPPKGAAVAFVDIQELKVRADVSNLPEKIVVNVEGLTDGTKVFAKDIELPEGAELDVEHAEESVVTIEVPEDATEFTSAPEAAAPADADAAAPAADADAK